MSRSTFITSSKFQKSRFTKMPKWKKLLHVLANRKKIDSAAIFDTEGAPLARTENFAEKVEDVMSVINVLKNSENLKLVRLNVFGDVFTCLCPSQRGVVVANANERLFAAIMSEHAVVIAFSDEDAKGSCLYELMEFHRLLENKGL